MPLQMMLPRIVLLAKLLLYMFRNKSIFPVLARNRLEESLVLWVNLLLFGIILSDASLIATPPPPPPPYYEATQTPPQDCEHARVQLIADTSIVVPGKSFLLGIRFELEKTGTCTGKILAPVGFHCLLSGIYPLTLK